MHINRDRLSFPQKPICIFAGVLIGLLVGCAKPANTTWSANAVSPDGHWEALAHSYQNGNFGSDNDVTIVQLKRTSSRDSPIEILLFSQEYATIYLKMDWISSKHLLVTYGPSKRAGDHVDLDFQAIRCAGVDITVQDISSASPGSVGGKN